MYCFFLPITIYFLSSLIIQFPTEHTSCGGIPDGKLPSLPRDGQLLRHRPLAPPSAPRPRAAPIRAVVAPATPPRRHDPQLS